MTPVTEAAVPAEAGLFTWPSDEPQLIGARCTQCESYFFPSFAEYHRPNCPGGPVETVHLSRVGTVTSYTVQRYPPPPPYLSPEDFQPFGLVTVAIPEGLQIPGQVATDFDLEKLTVGVEAELVVEPLYVDDDGVTRVTWKFRPKA